MFALLQKEIKGFLSSLIGYIVIIVFLLTLGLFMWVFPGNFNVLEMGYANIDPLFTITPWVYLFLIPAITMRLFADERKSGTIELLLTRPLTDLQIILAKYFAGFLLVLFSLLPTLVFYFTVHKLGNPPGNIDTGGMWGSYIGLLLLGAAFVSIGIFCSAITENQIIAFIASVFISFFCFTGFDSLSSIPLFQNFDSIIIKLGMNAHYLSLSRGVADSRDVVYFISLIAIFILFTKTSLESRKWN